MSTRHNNRLNTRNSLCQDHVLIRALPFLLALLLAACAGTDTTFKAEQDTAASAEAAFARGQYELAASNWQKEALDASAGEASSLRIRAADAWLLAGQPGKAQDQLRWIDRKSLSRQDRSRLNLVLADLALRNGRPDEADILLRQARESMPSASRKRYDSLYARMLGQISSPGSKNIGQAAKISAHRCCCRWRSRALCVRRCCCCCCCVVLQCCPGEPQRSHDEAVHEKSARWMVRQRCVS